MISSLGPSTSQSNANTLVFGSINGTGFVVLISTATIVAAIGALNFLGTGENAEGIHIAWITAVILGMWAILTALDGILSGSPSSFFIQLDAIFSFDGFGIGDVFYLFLTILVTLGTVGTVSRSSGAGGGV